MSRDVCKPPGGPDRAPLAPRRAGFSEVASGYDPAEAQAAAARCLAALACTYCEVCQLMCPDQCITRAPDTGDILIDLNHCKGCGLCVRYCPPEVLFFKDDLNVQGYHPAHYTGSGCTGCAICFYVCPEPGAITVYRREGKA